MNSARDHVRGRAFLDPSENLLAKHRWLYEMKSGFGHLVRMVAVDLDQRLQGRRVAGRQRSEFVGRRGSAQCGSGVRSVGPLLMRLGEVDQEFVAPGGDGTAHPGQLSYPESMQAVVQS